MKKPLFTLVSVLVFFSLGSISSLASFNDISGHTYEKEILFIEKSKLIKNSEKFYPDAEITRAEFVKIILLTKYSQKKIDTSSFYQNKFSDLEKTDWFFSYANFAKSKQIISGYENNVFKGNANITKGEAIKIVSNVLLGGPIKSAYCKNDSQWWCAYSQSLQKVNMSLAHEYRLKGNENLKRGEMAKLMYSSRKFISPTDSAQKIVSSARAQIGKVLYYDTGYYAGGYPPEDRGACTDVLSQALLDNGYNIKSKIDSDMSKNSSQYSASFDRNINFRRVRNVRIFLSRFALSLPTCVEKSCFESSDWQAGDIVTYDQIPGSLWHVAIVSDKKNAKGIPLLIHNYGRGVIENDYLKTWPAPISGHFRMKNMIQ